MISSTPSPKMLPSRSVCACSNLLIRSGTLHPAIALKLKGSGHLVQLFNRFLLELSDIEMRT